MGHSSDGARHVSRRQQLALTGGIRRATLP
jgi:hypothetical protein